MKRIVICCSLLLLIMYNGRAQDFFPEKTILYDHATLPRIDVTLDQADLDVILQPGNEQADVEYMAVFKFTSQQESYTIDSVGFRLRGNTSRVSAKKSFKISLNTFVRGQKFQGVEKINLNGEHNDPSITRALTCWYVYEKAGVPASRANHVELYVNNEFKGIYANVEHIDDEFVDLRFGKKSGNLYKCLWGATLEYLGDDPNLYKDQHSSSNYELKINEEVNDYSDLANFISILNHTSPENFPEELEPHFNVNSFLKNQAVEVLCGHWDGYAYNKNNYYLYHNVGTDKFEFIPYDPDNTLGVDWISRDWSSRNIYSWAQNSGYERPLYRKIMQNQVYKDRYSFYLNEIMEDVFNRDSLDPFLDHAYSLIKDKAEADQYRTLDYGYDYLSFLNALDQASGGHVKQGIKPFVSARYASAQDQLNLNDIDPIITLMHMNTPEGFEVLRMKFLVEDDDELSSVKMFYDPGSSLQEGRLTEIEDGLYYTQVLPPVEGDEVKFYLEARDSQQNVSRDPVSGYYRVTWEGLVDVVPEVSKSQQLNLYPNPAHDYVVLSLPEEDRSFAYSVYDLTGKLCHKGETRSNVRLELPSELQQGVYVLRVHLKDYRPQKFLIK